VDDVFYDPTDVTVTLSIVEVAETSRVFVVVGVGFELFTVNRLPLQSLSDVRWDASASAS
jgi:hypothetical protein